MNGEQLASSVSSYGSGRLALTQTNGHGVSAAGGGGGLLGYECNDVQGWELGDMGGGGLKTKFKRVRQKIGQSHNKERPRD